MPTDIPRQRVQHLVAEGALVIDVRPDGEYQDEHIVGAISIPLKSLGPATVGGLDPIRATVVY